VTSSHQVFVQAGGLALRIPRDALAEEAGPGGALRQLLLSYQWAFLAQVSQEVACNGLHTVRQRCCRWLLENQDRIQAAALRVTHEFLAQMLGVRRASVSEVVEALQADRLIRSERGRVTVLDRCGLEAASCECYRAVRDEFDRRLGRSSGPRCEGSPKQMGPHFLHSESAHLQEVN
jgi:hypothetical protein